MKPAKRKLTYWRNLIFGLGCLTFTLVLAKLPSIDLLPPAHCQPKDGQANLSEQILSPQPDRLEHIDLNEPEADSQILLKPSKIDQSLEEMSEENIRKHPYLFFRKTMNHPPKVGKCFFYLTLIGLIALYFRRADVIQAKDFCRKKFFRCFGIGFIATLLITLLARPLFLSEIGFPLAIVFSAILELGLLLGLVVGASLTGEKIADVLAISRLSWLNQRPSYGSIVHLLLGALLLAIALLIPGIGHLPRIGTRIVALIGITGMGALLNSKLAEHASDK